MEIFKTYKEVINVLEISCRFCGGITKHKTSCPYYVPTATNYTCNLCGEPIGIHDEYINNGKKYAHWDCIENKEDLLDFLDKSINIVSDDYEY